MPLSQLFFWGVPILALFSYCLLMLFFSMSQKDKYIRTYMLILAAMIIWTASSVVMKLQLYPGVLFWNKMMVTGTCTVPVLIFYFISVFTNSFNRTSVAFWGFLWFLGVAMNWMGLVVTDAGVLNHVILVNDRQYTTVEFYYTVGPAAYFLYCIMFSIFVACIMKAHASVRYGYTTYERVNLVIIGGLIMFAGNVLNLFPAIGKYPVDILACFINAILVVVAIYKYRMLELRLMITKGIIYSIMALFITSLYVYFVFCAEKYMGRVGLNITPYLTTFAALLVAIVFQPLYGVARNMVDRMFYKSEYSRRQALQHFSESISNNLNLDEISQELIQAIELGIHAREIFVLMKDEDTEYYSILKASFPASKSDFRISSHHPIVKWLAKNKTSLSREELYTLPFDKSMRKREMQVIYNLDIEVITPFIVRNDLIGMLMLSRKKNNAAYMMDDLDLLTYLGTSSAVAIDNARLFARARSEAQIDSLTKLYNHRYFHKALAEQVETIDSAALSLIILDLDLFKLYNDLYGHFEGDQALEKVASIMLRIVGNTGIVCRYGGEEFTVLLPHYDSARAFHVAEEIRLEIQRAFFNTGDVIQRFLSASLGICTYPIAAPNARELLKRADLALYTAKSNGKNQSVIYTPDIDSPGTQYEQDLILKPNYTATIYALTAAIDAKDHYTFGHSQRVADYATSLARSLGLDKSHLEVIRQAALLHDIGKIGIPENILTKTGQLSTEEFTIVKSHVEMSITIIKHLPSFNHVIPAVIGHHERWDGCGYPRRINGENIPLAARCLAISDAFDAMTSDRPYKKGLSVKDALREIKDHAGTQFDPQLAASFINLVADGTIKMDQNIKIQNTG